MVAACEDGGGSVLELQWGSPGGAFIGEKLRLAMQVLKTDSISNLLIESMLFVGFEEGKNPDQLQFEH
jgi:hypothetical protein